MSYGFAVISYGSIVIRARLIMSVVIMALLTSIGICIALETIVISYSVIGVASVRGCNISPIGAVITSYTIRQCIVRKHCKDQAKCDDH